jgi:purine-binding chemotaxis protein CheW
MNSPDHGATTHAQSITGVGPHSGDRGHEFQLVTFEVAGERCAIDLLAVQQINRMMELTRVPHSPPELEGVINLRGKIIPVLDLRTRLGLEAGVRSEHSRIIVVEAHARVIGFIVDRVHEVLRVGREIVEPAPGMVTSIDADFIAGVGKLDDRLLILLDLPRLFSSELLRASEHIKAGPNNEVVRPFTPDLPARRVTETLAKCKTRAA